MPTIRGRTRGWRRDEMGDEHRRVLLTGHDYGSVFQDASERRGTWDELRDELLPTWIAANPGTRPWAWWAFDAPERRQRVNGLHPFDNPERFAQLKRLHADASVQTRSAQTALFFGKPRMLITRDDFTAKYETEPQYLRRLDLLTEAEAEALEQIEADPLVYYFEQIAGTADEAHAQAAMVRERAEPTRVLDGDALRDREIDLRGERGDYETTAGRRFAALLHIDASYRRGDKSVAASAQLFDGVLPEAIVALWKGEA